jgi:hypothetical protein
MTALSTMMGYLEDLSRADRHQRIIYDDGPANINPGMSFQIRSQQEHPIANATPDHDGGIIWPRTEQAPPRRSRARYEVGEGELGQGHHCVGWR